MRCAAESSPPAAMRSDRLSREITGEVIQELVAFVDVEAWGGFAGFVQLTA